MAALFGTFRNTTTSNHGKTNGEVRKKKFGWATKINYTHIIHVLINIKLAIKKLHTFKIQNNYL
jgi:hypothetical protein